MPETRLEILGVGPQKTATSWLTEVLAPTQALCFPSGVKETFFWDRHFDRGIDWYMAHFKGHGRYIEFGPTYFHSAEAVERLHAHNPDLKVIVTLRDPAARSWSLYQHHLRKGRVDDSFEEADVQFPEIRQASRYSLHVPRWQAIFGEDQVLVLMQDEVQQDPGAVLARVGRFIGESLETETLDLGRRVNAAGHPPSRALASVSTRAAETLRRLGLYGVVNMAKSAGLKRIVYGGGTRGADALPDDLRAQLVGEFEADIAFVEHSLGIDLGHWRKVGAA